MASKEYTEEHPPTIEEVSTWINSGKNINPRTNKFITSTKKSYRILETSFNIFKRNGEIDDEGHITKIMTPKNPRMIEPENPYRDEKGFPIHYNKETHEKYIGLRKAKLDPILYIEVDESIAIKFDIMWNPYNDGIITGIDPVGSLYFHPDTLIKIFFDKMLNGLWHPEVDEGAGGDYIEGYYGDCVGMGDDKFIIRGHSRPECYLFRIPLDDLYLPSVYNYQVPVMTPKITREKIDDIYTKACKNDSNYIRLYRRERPNLIKMWNYYHVAIAKHPMINLKPYINSYIKFDAFNKEHPQYEEYQKYISVITEDIDKSITFEKVIEIFNNELLFMINTRDKETPYEMALDIANEIAHLVNIEAVNKLKEL
jgi:hypothetical protein